MIQVHGLTKYYGEHAAIRNLAFDIAKGEVIGFLGLNGAGKTTTLKILGCVLLPTSGSVTVDGIDALAQPHELRRRIGFLPDVPPLYNEMTVGEYLTFAARLRGVRSGETAARVAEAEEKTSLTEMDGELISSLSHGYRQRVGVAQALVHKPALLILDEPTSGLDPVQIVDMRGLIKRLRGEHTLLISSHFLAEISQTCDRLLVIQGGEIVRQGTESELASGMAGGLDIELRVRGPAEAALAVVRGLPGVVQAQAHVENAEGEVDLSVRAASDLRPALVRALVAAEIDVLRVDRSASSLEQIFLQLTQTSPRPETRT